MLRLPLLRNRKKVIAALIVVSVATTYFLSRFQDRVYRLVNLREEYQCRPVPSAWSSGTLLSSCDPRSSASAIRTLFDLCRRQRDKGSSEMGQPCSFVATSAERSFVGGLFLSPAGRTSGFLIHSCTANGGRKSSGLDAWNVSVVGPASLPAIVTDLLNGSYSVRFLPVESGSYRVTVTLDYTSCDAFTEPPGYWRKMLEEGLVDTNSSVYASRYISQPLKWGGMFSIYISPPVDQDDREREDDCDFRSRHPGLGRWLSLNQSWTWVPYMPRSRVSSFERVSQKQGVLLFYGDSTASRLRSSLHTSPYSYLCTEVFQRCDLVYNHIYQVMRSRDAPLEAYSERRVLDQLREHIYHPDFNDANSLLVLNYGLHWVEEFPLHVYLSLLESLLHILSSTELWRGRRRHFLGRVAWVSSVAVHRDNYAAPHSVSGRYLNNKRIELFNYHAERQFVLAGFPVFDLYWSTSTWPLGMASSNDAVHYPPEMYHKLLRELSDFIITNMTSKS